MLYEKNINSKAIHASVIIVNWNTKDLLRTCLSGLLQQQNVKLDIFVVDNNSSDGSVFMLKNEFPMVRCIANTHNAGFAAANNQALAIATGEYLLLINPDIEFESHDTISKFLLKQKELTSGIAGLMLKNSDFTIQHSVRSDPTFFSQVLILLKLHLLFPSSQTLKNYYLPNFAYNQTQKVHQISGAFFSISRECFDQVKFMDEQFYIWFEEVDYCFRARQKGFTVSYIANASVIHHGAQSFQKLLPRSRQTLFNKSLLLYSKKHFSKIQHLILLLVLPINLLLAFITPSSIRPSHYRMKI